MHRTLKLETTKPAAFNLLQQQEKFEKFKDEFNFERPHQALDMKCPADVYKKSKRPYQGLPDITYPGYDKTLLEASCGRICFKKKKIHLSKAFANQPVGLKEVDDGIFQVDFLSYTLGFFDEESNKFAPCEDPFGFKLDSLVL